MSSEGYPSSSERKQYNEEDEKLLNFIRQYRSQSMPQGQLFHVHCVLCKTS